MKDKKQIEQYKFPFYDKVEVRPKSKKFKPQKLNKEIEQFEFPFIYNYESPQDLIS